MRDEISKTTYILGAGASKSAGGPLVDNFLEKACKLNVLKDTMPLKGFLDNLYSVKETHDYPNIEEVLTIIDKAIQKEEPLGGFESTSNMHSLKEEVRYVIRKTLEKAKTKDPNKAYSRFIRQNVSQEDTLISLNYDLYLDNEIYHEYAWIDYGINFKTLGAPLGDYKSFFNIENEKEDTPILLKLHGSVNWLYCPLGEEIYLSQRALADIQGVQFIQPEVTPNPTVCPEHNVDLESVIVYPTWLKSYDMYQINQIWSLALKEISESDEIVFIGYSMPSSDMEIRYLLKKSLMVRNMSNTPKKYLMEEKIRNPSVENEDSLTDFDVKVVNKKEEKDFKQKYKTFFKSEVEFIEENFEDWVD